MRWKRRKHIGYPMNEPLHIQIISPHDQCRLARRLLETVREVVQTLDFPTTVESVFSFQEFIRLRVFRPPVLVVNGKVLATGSQTRKKVENLLKREKDSLLRPMDME